MKCSGRSANERDLSVKAARLTPAQEDAMDGALPSTSPPDLANIIGTAAAPIIVDVRSMIDLAVVDRLIPGAIHHPQDDVEHLYRALPASRPIVVCDLSGNHTSWTVVEALRGFGVDARYLMDGFVGWQERGLPTRRNVNMPLDKWVTREHPKIDRIACPWLISRFVNPLGEFIYVPPSDVLAVAKQEGAIPYDIKGVEFGHVGDRCSFDAIMRVLDIKDPALDHLATIVRGADTSRPDLAPQCDGLLAISYGLSGNFPDDHEMLRHGMVIYDALYTWCRNRRV
jgi:rhodanese-related sulfurtransferase